MENDNIQNTLLYNIFLNTINFEYPYNAFMSNKEIIVGLFKKSNKLYNLICVDGVVFYKTGMMKINNYEFNVSNYTYHKYNENEYDKLLKVMTNNFSIIKKISTQLNDFYINENYLQNMCSIGTELCIKPLIKCNSLSVYQYFYPYSTKQDFKRYKQKYDEQEKEFEKTFKRQEKYIGNSFLSKNHLGFRLFMIKKIDNNCNLRGSCFFIRNNSIYYAEEIPLYNIDNCITVSNDLYFDIVEKYNEITTLNNL